MNSTHSTRLCDGMERMGHYKLGYNNGEGRELRDSAFEGLWMVSNGSVEENGNQDTWLVPN